MFRSAHGPARSRGFTIVEIMVAALIGLIGSIVIFQVFAVSEGQRRTTTSGGDAQQNGVLALFTIERDLRMAGFGITYGPLVGCRVLAYDAGPPARDFNFKLIAVEITDGAAGAPDSITLMYGNSDLVLSPAKLTSPAVASSSVYKVDNRYGFKEGDLIIGAESGKDCSMGQVTGVPGTPGQTDNVIHNPGTYTNAQGVNVPARYNKAGGLGVDYAAWDNTSQTGGRLYNIGSAPTIITYAVASAQLTNLNSWVGGGANAIVDSIVQLQAEYGKDTDGDGTVNLWEATMPVTPTAADWSSILAVRLAVVARSALRERANPATGVCDITAAPPAWAGGTITLAADPDWQCYRYRVFETVVPLRNLIWKPE